MRLLILTENFPPTVGGSGAWIAELYRSWPVGSVWVANEYGQAPAGYPHPVEHAPLRFPSWGVLSFAGAARYARSARRVRRLIQQQQIDLVHANRCLPEGLIASRTDRPYLCTVHGEELNSMGQSRELTWLARRVFAGASGLIATSRNTARLLHEKWSIDPQRIRIVHPGVDLERCRPGSTEEISAARQRLGWNGRKVVLTVGRLQRRKGQDMMIRALPVVRRRAGDVIYAILGEGEDKGRLRSLAEEHGVAEHVRFIAPLLPEELVAAYQAADLFVLPNRDVNGDFEGFGMVLIEAQACGTPVIAGRSGGAPETLIDGQTGRVLDASDPVSLADAATELLRDDAQHRRMAAAARRHAERRFDWQKIADAHHRALTRAARRAA